MINMNFPNLENAIESAKTYSFDNYIFRLFDFGENGQYLSHGLIKEITTGMSESIKNNFSDFDYIVAPEPGGHTWGLLAANSLGKDINIFRVLPSKLEGEIEIPRKTPYNQGHLYINYIKKGDKVIIVDDVIYRGGTLESILKVLKENEVSIVGIQTILAKTDNYLNVQKKYDVKIKFLMYRNYSLDLRK